MSLRSARATMGDSAIGTPRKRIILHPASRVIEYYADTRRRLILCPQSVAQTLMLTRTRACAEARECASEQYQMRLGVVGATRPSNRRPRQPDS